MAGYRKIELVIFFVCFGIQACPQTFYIKAGQVFDGQELSGSKIIIINDGLITDLMDPQSSLPDTIEVIDALGCTVLPGFIDSHIHFMTASIPYISEIEKFWFQ